jgi:2-oxoglutarate dehydrogenase E1 component
VDLLRQTLERYRKAKDWVWVQEESLNMGGWTFMEPRLRAMGYAPRYVGRDSSASPATGSRQIHLREQKELVEAALTGPVPHLVRATGTDGRRSEYLKTLESLPREQEAKQAETEPV